MTTEQSHCTARYVVQHRRSQDFLRVEGVHLQLAPINYTPNFFLCPRGVRAPPGYAYAVQS